jgi:hypothetical protein
VSDSGPSDSTGIHQHSDPTGRSKMPRTAFFSSCFFVSSPATVHVCAGQNNNRASKNMRCQKENSVRCTWKPQHAPKHAQAAKKPPELISQMASKLFDLFGVTGAPGEIRTPDLLIRSQSLYPAELRAHTCGLKRNHRQIIRDWGRAQSARSTPQVPSLRSMLNSRARVPWRAGAGSAVVRHRSPSRLGGRDW